MNWISLICFAICIGIFLSIFRHKADILSPGRLFGFIWSLAIGLVELKFSALQHNWTIESWVLLLTGIAAFLVGIFITFVLHSEKELVSIHKMRQILAREQVHEGRLFGFICLSLGVYAVSYIANYLVRGWLPLDTVGTAISRVDFNVSGLTLFLYSATFIIFFILLYFLLVPGRKARKAFLIVIFIMVVGSFFLLLQRYPIIMAMIICFTLLYYATRFIRMRTAIPFFAAMTAFFFWISSLRFSNVVSTYLYSISKMRFSRDYAFFTEPYMYVVTNLENFARSVSKADYHTYGYFTFDFITAITGLKYWVLEYFSFERTPYLTNSYNTYTAFWWFYSDFGVIGLALIPLILGFGTGMLYYRMRLRPTIKNVSGYGVMVFAIFISYFNFPFAFLWFEYNMLALYLILRWTLIPNKALVQSQSDLR